MIEGLHFDFTTEDLRALLLARAEYHDKRAAFYAEEAARYGATVPRAHGRARRAHGFGPRLHQHGDTLMTDSNKSGGCGFGLFFSLLSGVLSWATFHSIGWALVAGLLGPFYFLYFVIRYGFARVVGLF